MKHTFWKIVAYICAGGWTLGLIGILLFPAKSYTVWSIALVNGLCDMLAVPADGWLANILPWAMALCAYALLAVFWKWAVSRYVLSIGISSGVALACALIIGGNTWLLLLVQVGGALLGSACVALWHLAWKRFPRVFNRETVSYVVFGALTTVVNIVSYMVTVAVLPFGDVINTAVANTVAWVLSVLFAYVVNKLFVFRSHTDGVKALLWEAGKFIGARAFSFGVDEVGMLLLVNVIGVPDFWAKVLTNVLVLIMNYFFSKLIIFKGNTQQ